MLYWLLARHQDRACHAGLAKPIGDPEMCLAAAGMPLQPCSSKGARCSWGAEQSLSHRMKTHKRQCPSILSRSLLGHNIEAGCGQQFHSTQCPTLHLKQELALQYTLAVSPTRKLTDTCCLAKSMSFPCTARLSSYHHYRPAQAPHRHPSPPHLHPRPVAARGNHENVLPWRLSVACMSDLTSTAAVSASSRVILDC